MPFPLEKDHDDPAQVTTYDAVSTLTFVRQSTPADVLVRQRLTAAAPLTVVNRAVATGVRAAVTGTSQVAQRIRLSTLPPYFSAYVPNRGGGGGGGGGPVKLPPVKFDPPGKGVGTPEFIGRSRDRLKL